ncbi:MAG: hypothetical protein QOI57_992 [Rubrobacteraceae bacterium]|nr:hypothetical protein [Rubrobacteraceae bacterium]
MERVVPEITAGVEYDNFFTAELVQNLPARPAREAGCDFGAHNDDETYTAVVRIGVGDHPGNSVALGTDREPVGSVLDVATGIEDAASGQNRGTNPEVAIRSVGFGRDRARSLYYVC